MNVYWLWWNWDYLSQLFGIYLVAFAFNSFYEQEVTQNNVRLSVAIPDMEAILASTPKDTARNFKKLIRKRLVRDIHQNQNKLV